MQQSWRALDQAVLLKGDTQNRAKDEVNVLGRRLMFPKVEPERMFS